MRSSACMIAAAGFLLLGLGHSMADERTYSRSAHAESANQTRARKRGHRPGDLEKLDHLYSILDQLDPSSNVEEGPSAGTGKVAVTDTHRKPRNLGGKAGRHHTLSVGTGKGPTGGSMLQSPSMKLTQTAAPMIRDALAGGDHGMPKDMRSNLDFHKARNKRTLRDFLDLRNLSSATLDKYLFILVSSLFAVALVVYTVTQYMFVRASKKQNVSFEAENPRVNCCYHIFCQRNSALFLGMPRLLMFLVYSSFLIALQEWGGKKVGELSLSTRLSNMVLILFLVMNVMLQFTCVTEARERTKVPSARSRCISYLLTPSSRLVYARTRNRILLHHFFMSFLNPQGWQWPFARPGVSRSPLHQHPTVRGS